MHAAALVGAVAAFCLATSACTSDSNLGDGYGARDACRTWVKDQLKAPSTAKFSGESGFDSDDGPWTITGNVDAENSFGALLRNEYVCTIKLDGDTYRGNVSVDDGE